MNRALFCVHTLVLNAVLTSIGCSSEPPARDERGRMQSAPELAGTGGGVAPPPPATPSIDQPTQSFPVAGAASSVPGLVMTAGSGAAPVCARDKYHAEQAKLTIYTLFDESGSMLLWWVPVTDAFTRFLRDPRSAGINIGLKFFGIDCDPNTYGTPDVPIGPLPENADAIAQQLSSRIPLAQTPTAQAVQGAATALAGYATSHPNEKVVILLVTDASSFLGEGDPEDCYSTIPQASEVAGMAHAANPSIQTYVLGLGDAAGLNMLSRAGGTGDAFSADPAASDQVVEAMHQIRKRALPCEYALPAGAEKTPNLVNLEVTASGGSSSTVSGVGSVDACHASAGGWYYDNPAQPTRLIACPATCTAFDAAAEVNVVLGCPTIGPD